MGLVYERLSLEISCPLCGEDIIGSRQLIDVCPSCQKPWREAYFAQAAASNDNNIEETIKDCKA